MTTTVIKDLGLMRVRRCGTCYHNIFDMNMQKRDYEKVKKKKKKNLSALHTHAHRHTGCQDDKKRGKRKIFFFLLCLRADADLLKSLCISC